MLMRCAFLMILLLALPGSGATAQTAAETEQQIKALKERIRSVERAQQRDARRHSEAEKQLRATEEAVAAARQRIRQLAQDEAAIRARQAALEAAAASTRQQLAGHQQALAAQLRKRHREGEQARLRLLLSQQDPVRLGRQLVYYDYLNRQQLELLASISEELARLADNAAALRREAAALAALAGRQAEELAGLEAARSERRTLLDGLAGQLADQDAELATLREQGAQLEQLLERLRQAVARAPAVQPLPGSGPFANARKQILWPVQGQVLSDYGRPRADGQLRWEGLMLAAEPGSEVRAVFHGTVIYADWLPGLGLLSVIDHGGGYMSLYGHNQALLRGVGERVAGGDIIAEAGDSGGLGRASLYFEIRKDGRPVNPRDWLP